MFLWVCLCVCVCVHWSSPLLGKQGAIPKGPASRLTQFPSLAYLYCLSSPTVLLGSGGRHRLWGQPACHPPFPALVITWGGLGGGLLSASLTVSAPNRQRLARPQKVLVEQLSFIYQLLRMG